MDFHYKDTRKLSNIHNEAHLIYSSDRDFYNIFNKTESEICKNIISMIRDERTEMHYIKSVFLDNKLVGIVNFYNSIDIQVRRLFGLNYLLSNSTVSNNDINDFSKNVPDIVENSMYLSRIGIIAKERSNGYSKEILKYYESASILQGHDMLSLHVHKNNKIALNVYKKFGFSVSESNYSYLKLLKSIGA